MIEETQCQRKHNGRGNAMVEETQQQRKHNDRGNTMIEETEWQRKHKATGNTIVEETQQQRNTIVKKTQCQRKQNVRNPIRDKQGRLQRCSRSPKERKNLQKILQKLTVMVLNQHPCMENIILINKLNPLIP